MPPADRGTLLATLMFTDIVRSSQIAEELGDRRWRELLARHHAIVRRELKRFNGRELDTAGDGFFAAFTRPAEGVRCAAAILDGVGELGVEIRVGLHVGEAEVFGSKLSGMTVHVAARTMATAGPGEILVTGVLKDMVPGAGFRLEDRGVHQLKGVPGDWRLYQVTAIDDQALPAKLDPEAARERRDAIQAPRLPRRVRPPLVASGAAVIVALMVVAFLAIRSSPAPSASPTAGTSPLASPPRFTLVRIDAASRRVVGSIKLPGKPSAVVFADGSAWVADVDADAVLRIDPASGRVTATILVGNAPNDLAVGDNAIWVSNYLSTSVSRIDPATNKVAATVPVGTSPRSIAANDEGVWVTTDTFGVNYPPTGLVTRIDPVTNAAVSDESYTSPCPLSVAANTEAVWIVSTTGVVWRADPRSDRRSRVVSLGIAAAWLLAEEDTLWVGSDGLPAKVFAVDPTTAEVSLPIPVGVTKDGGGPGCVPIHLASGNGNIWVTNLDDRSISVIARLSKSVIATIAVAGRPTGVAFGLGTVWVTVDGT